MVAIQLGQWAAFLVAMYLLGTRLFPPLLRRAADLCDAEDPDNTTPRLRLAEVLLEKKRYTDAAKAYGAFTASHPKHPLGPAFQNKAIAAEEATDCANAPSLRTSDQMMWR